MSPLLSQSRGSAGRAFSLVELLMVIVILMTLIALLLPQMIAGRERALDVQCQFNIKNMGLAMLGYSRDHNGRFSQWNQTFRGDYYDGLANHETKSWTEDPMTWPITKSDIFPYTNSHKVYVCPIYDRYTAEPAAWTYTQNWNAGPTGGWKGQKVARASLIINPAQFAMFAEETPWVHGFTEVQTMGGWDVSDDGHYSKYAMNDARIVSASSSWPKIDTMATHHRPLENRYKFEMVKTDGTILSGYAPKNADDILMNTGGSFVAFSDGHVEFVDTTLSPMVMHNDQTKVKYTKVE